MSSSDGKSFNRLINPSTKYFVINLDIILYETELYKYILHSLNIQIYL